MYQRAQIKYIVTLRLIIWPGKLYVSTAAHGNNSELRGIEVSLKKGGGMLWVLWVH